MNTSAIITITPNPCIDISASVPELIRDRKLQCTRLVKEPGGGGINVSRVLQRLGSATKAIYFSGGYTGDYFNSMLTAEGVTSVTVKIAHDTRENVVIAEESSGAQYRFGMPGPHIQEAEYNEMLKVVASERPADYLVASGSLSAGLPVKFFAQLAAIAKRNHTKFILDSSGEALLEALDEGLYLIKPNMRELGFISGKQELTAGAAVEIAKAMVEKKQAEMVVISMADAGAFLISSETVERAVAPPVKTKSTVGAGDSMLAGIVHMLAQKKTFREALAFGVSCGTATTLNEGTALCQQDMVNTLYQQVLRSSHSC
ncbi:MAG: hexose kinase, 1-phosphofructokinase family [Ferruginibacter sp.]|nr:hexose kinase, 1-phosphofructokinase family [Ferruginibacter sp.]